MKYEESIRRICGEDWKTINREEREGGYGVGCVIAYIRGAKPSLNDLASHLGASIDDLAPGYNRLVRAGVFTSRWNTKRDEVLRRGAVDEEGHRAWSHLAAIAAGFIGNF